MTKDQLITDNYAIYNSDCMYILPQLPNKSIDLSIYSPPFAGLYNYSSSENDFSNCESKEQFLEQYEFLVSEIARVTKPGRITAVHVTDVIDTKTGELWDLPGKVKKIHKRHGFKHRNTVTIWKEPLKVRMRTMVRSLMHKLIVEDSTECFTAMPDYLLVFKRDGTNESPVCHPLGLSHYAGELPLLHAHLDAYGLDQTIAPVWNDREKKYSMTDAVEGYIEASFNNLKKKYEGHQDPKSNKLSHIIWQRYASSIWDDIRIDNVLPFRESKEEDDEKHIHPLQLDVYDRVVELYSNPGDTVLEPFLGVGSGVYSAVSMGRKGISIELKDSYYKQAVKNLAVVDSRFSKNDNQTSLFDTLPV